jgi:hypothetical protein
MQKSRKKTNTLAQKCGVFNPIANNKYPPQADHHRSLLRIFNYVPRKNYKKQAPTTFSVILTEIQHMCHKLCRISNYEC